MASVKTYGLAHIALAVKSAERSAHFYQQVFGMKITYQYEGWIQVETPGCHDVIVFEEKEKIPASTGGIAHFGFRLTKPEDINIAITAIEEAGGTIIKKGEFSAGHPYVFFKDPDGYEIEVWYE